LRDQAPGEALAPGVRLDPDRDLVPEPVGAHDADTGQVVAAVVERDQRPAAERAQPAGQPRRDGVDPPCSQNFNA
jgi:hypothetical protein